MSLLKSASEAAERAALIEALLVTRGEVEAAARELGVSRRTAYRRIAQYQIDTDAIRRLGRAAYPGHRGPM